MESASRRKYRYRYPVWIQHPIYDIQKQMHTDGWRAQAGLPVRKPAGRSAWNGAGSAAEAETRGTPPPLAQSRRVRRGRSAQVLFTAVVTDDGALWPWGKGVAGKQGIQDRGNSLEPTRHISVILTTANELRSTQRDDPRYLCNNLTDRSGVSSHSLLHHSPSPTP